MHRIPSLPVLRCLLLVGVLALAGCEKTVTTGSDDVSTSDPLTIQEQIDAAAIGDTVHINEGTYEESLVLPSDIHLCGKEGAKVVITPPADTPGIVVVPGPRHIIVPGSAGSETSSGSPSLDDEDGEELPETGAPPINIIAPATQGAKSRICNLTVQSATGHGILSQGVSLELENVKIDDTLRAGDESPGHGVHIEEAASLLATDVQVTGSAGVGVSVVNVMDVKFTVTDFVATPDPDAVGVVWPDYMPNPETMGASLVSGNDGGGISVVWPDYMPNPDGSAPVQAIAIEGVSIAENGHFGIQVTGCALSLDQAVISGTLLPKASSDPLDITIPNGQGILAKGAVSVTMNNCIVEKNAGAGLVSAVSGPLLLGGQNGIPRPSDDDGGEVGVVWPDYLPSNHFFYNAGGGLALIDPIDPEAGKADEASDAGNRIAGASFAGNGRFGMQIEGATLAIERSVVRDTTRQPDASDGDGLRVLGGKSTSNVTLDASSIVTDNEGFGVRAGSGAAVAIASEISKNNDGGVWARGKGAAISLQPDARIANNRAVGVAVLEEALLSVDSATIEGTTRTLASDPLFGDAIWAVKTAGLNISGATIRNNARVGLLLGSPPASATLKDITFADNAYGMVSLKSDSVQVSEYPDCEDCSFEDNTISNEEAGLCLEIYLDCNPSIEPGCEPFNPCGDCSCPEDVVCTEENCTAPCEQDSDCWDDTCKNYQCAQETGQCVAPPDEAKFRTVGSCDDGLSCTTGDTCNAEGQCAGPCLNSSASCWIGTSCSNDTNCNASEPAPLGTPCDDGFPCTLDDACPGGGDGCEGTPDESLCDDNDVCTTDTCVNSGTQELSCTNVDIVCGDGLACLKEASCYPASGCDITYEDAGASCDDGDDCTEDDICNPDHDCIGTDLNCDDGDVCSLDSCTAVVGCDNSQPDPSAPDGCDDGDPCTTGDACNGSSVCTGVQDDCNDGNPCTNEVCDDEFGCVITALPGEDCDDGDQCIVETTCSFPPPGSFPECVGGFPNSIPECADSSLYTCVDDGFVECQAEDHEECVTANEDEHLGAILICDGETPDSTSDKCSCLSGHTECDTTSGNGWAFGGQSLPVGLCLDGPSTWSPGAIVTGPGTIDLLLDITPSLVPGEYKFRYNSVDTTACKIGGWPLLKPGLGGQFSCFVCDDTGACLEELDDCAPGGGAYGQFNGVQNVPVGQLFNPTGPGGALEDKLYICAHKVTDDDVSTGWVKLKEGGAP